MELRLDKRSRESLTLYALNAKQHTPEQVAAIAASIERFGFNDPIGITPEGVVVEGHGRFLAAQRLGLEEVPVLVLEGFSERDIDLYRIAHNKIALTTGFDFGLLVEELRSITGQSDIKLIEMGFSAEAAERLFAMFPTEGQAKENVRVRSALSFDIVWDDADQRAAWTRFVEKVRARYPDEKISTAQALTRYIQECGVLQPVAQPALEAEVVEDMTHESL